MTGFEEKLMLHHSNQDQQDIGILPSAYDGIPELS
jgi:hypothetical protein